MLKKLFAELDARTGLSAAMRVALDERLPGGARFVYVFGSALAIIFGVQALTGIALALYYSPSATQAWASVFYIQYRVGLGWLVRNLHHYGAQAMMILLGLHLMQTFTFGAYKKPRELVWWSGLVLLFVVIGFGLTGYLLPWDQKGYWATRVATGIAGTTPLVGKQIQYVIQGGNEYGNLTLTRFYAIHVVLLPALLAGAVVLHIVLFRKAGGATVSWRIVDGKPDRPGARWLLALVVAAFLFAAGLATATFLPTPIALGIAILTGAIPVVAQGLRAAGLMSTRDDPKVVGEFWPDQLAVNALFSLGVVLALAAISVFRPAPLDAPADPTVNYLPRPDWYFLFLFQLLKYFEGPAQVLGTIVLPGLVTLFVFALPFLDRSPLRSPLSRARAPYVVLMYGMVAGVFLLTWLAVRADAGNPEVQRLRREADRAAMRARELASNGVPPEGGAALVAADPREHGRRVFHAKCDSCHTIDGAGGTKAPDLTGYLSQAWLVDLMNDPDSPRFYGHTKISGMDSFAKLGPDKVSRLAMFLHQLATQDVSPDRYPPDLKEGYQVYLEASCDGCHSLAPGETNAAPNLSGYGSARWLKDFLKDPGTPLFYDKDNHMPAFGVRLNPADLDATVTFLQHLAEEARTSG